MARTTATRKRTKTAAPAPAAKEGGVCLFSGEPTSSKRSRFRPGYDAKLKSLLLNVVRGDAKMSEIPKPALRVLKDGETLVGFKLAGDTVKAVGNFTVAKKAKTVPTVAKKTRRAKKDAAPRRRRRAESETEEVAAA